MSNIEDLENQIKDYKDLQLTISLAKITEHLTTICGLYDLSTISKTVNDNNFSKNDKLLKGLDISYDKNKLKELRKLLFKTQEQLLNFIKSNYKLFNDLSEKNKIFSKDIDFNELKQKLDKKYDVKSNQEHHYQGIS
jgi:2-hydroxy-3-keto-5-methylthiopentenyl-1-phosphate phosphatase